MDQLIVRSLQGHSSNGEEECLRRWRQEGSDHEDSYQRVAAVWRATQSYEQRVQTRAPAHEAIIAEAARRYASSGWTWAWRIVAAAATLVLGLGLGLWWTADREPTRGSEFVTGAGETATVRMTDGTVVRLGPESRLVIQPAGVAREVLLIGRAFFAVAEDRRRPFVVRTSAGSARVLGTRFEVNVRERHLRLVVLEGRVALLAGGKEVELETQQVSYVREGSEPTLVNVNDVWPLLGWLRGFMAFESTPLWQVGQELEQRFGVRLDIQGEDLSRQTVTVWFDNEPLDRVAGVLCQLVEAVCVVEESTVRMRAER